MDSPSLAKPVFLSVIAAILLVIAWKAGPMPTWFQWCLVIVGLILLFFATVAAAEWIVDHVGGSLSQFSYRVNQAKAITPDSEILKELARLQPYQAEIWLKRSTAMVFTPGIAGPTMFFDVDGELVPTDFVTDFLNKSEEYLLPIRTYSEGSQGRKWAHAITEFFVKRGLARPAVGNLPAKWTYGYADAVKWFAVTDEMFTGEEEEETEAEAA